MIVQYYPDTDMLYIRFADGISTDSEEVAPGIVVDYNEHNRVIGIEVEDASKLTDISRLEVAALPVTSLIMNQKSPMMA